MKSLGELGLQRVPLSLGSIQQLAALPLNKLILYNCDITDGDLASLANCKTLRELHLSGNPQITSTGLKLLAQLPIQHLNIEKVNISDPELKVFSDWKNLRTLDVSNCPGVTKAGADRLKASIHHDLSVLPFDEPMIKGINFGSPF